MSKSPKLYSAYGDRPSHGKQGNFGPSLTQQQFKDNCDVNSIVARYRRTADPSLLNRMGDPSFSDLTSVPSYQDALNKVIQAESAFSRLPAIVRKRFQNSPQELLAFVGDDSNYDEAVKLGFLDPVKVAARRVAVNPPPKPIPLAEPLPAASGGAGKGA